MAQHLLYVKRQKCEFGATQVEQSGHVISNSVVSMDCKKAACVLEWLGLQTVKELHGFLGLKGIKGDYEELWNNRKIHYRIIEEGLF